MTGNRQELGTLFTADTSDVKAKADALRRLLKALEADARKSRDAVSGEWKKAGAGVQDYKREIDKATAAVDKHTTAVRKAAKAEDTHQKAIGKRLGHIDSFANQLRSAFRVTAAYTIAGSAIYGLLAGIRAGVTEIVEFDQALRNLEAITGATAAQISVMRDEIMRVAHDTKYSTTEVAEGMVLLGQAGFSAEESINAIGAVSQLATGTLSEMQETADLLTTTIRAFNLDAVESSRVADVMANAINKSKLTIDKLRTAFNYIGAASRQAGLELEETAAAAMVLANNGLRASTIGTGLRQVLARLLSPNRNLRESFEAFGIELNKVNPRLVGFQKSIENLAPILWDNQRQVVDMSKAYEIFGLRGAQAAGIIVKSFLAGDYARALENAYEVGSAAEMAEKQAQGLGIMFKNMVDRAKLLAIAIGDLGITGALKIFINMTRVAIDALVAIAREARKVYDDLFGGMDGFIRRSEEQVVKTKQVVSSLEAYLGALESLNAKVEQGEDVKIRYNAVLQRLIQSHPELASKIDVTTGSYDQLGTAIEEVNRLLRESERMTDRQRGQVVGGYETQIQKLREGEDKWRRALKTLTEHAEADQMGEDIKFAEQMINDFVVRRMGMQERLSEVTEEWKEDIKRKFKGQDENWVELSAETYIDNLEAMGIVSTQFADRLRSEVIPELLKLNQSLKMDQFKAELKEWRSEFEDLYQSLNAVQQFEFIDKFKALQAKIAAAKKTAEEQNKMDDFPELQRAYEDEWLKAFRASLLEDDRKFVTQRIDVEKSYWSLKSKLATDDFEKAKMDHSARLEEIKKWYEAAKAEAEENGKDLVEVNNRYQSLLSENDQALAMKRADLERSLSMQELGIQKLRMEQEVELEKKSAAERSDAKKDFADQAFKIEQQYLKNVIEIGRKNVQSTKKIYGEKSKETLRAEEQLQKDILALRKLEAGNESQQLANRIRLEKKYWDLKSSFITDNLEKAKAAHAEQLREIEAWYEGAKAAALKHGSSLEEINNRYKTLLAENDQALDFKVAEHDLGLAMQELNIQKTVMEQEVEMEKAAAAQRLNIKREFRDEAFKIEQNFLLNVIAIYEQNAIDLYGKRSSEALRAQEKLQNSILALKRLEADQERRWAEESIAIEVKKLKDKLKHVKKFGAEYFQILKKLESYGEIIDRGVMFESMLAASDQWADGVRLALMRAESAHKTTSEMVADSWGAATNAMSDAFTSFVDDVLVGKVRSAGEYITDFLKDVARSMWQIFNQQLAMNLMSGLGSLITGGISPAPTNSDMLRWSGYVQSRASGGWIREPVVGRGMRTGDTYTIGEKEAELVTPRSQMTGGGPPNVTVEVYNNTGTQAQVQKEGPEFDGEKWVIAVMLNAVERNVMGARDAIKGVK